jgi:hypothetical protein
VALVSPEGVVQAMNLAGLTLIGARESAQIVGKPFTLLCDAHDADGVRAFVTQVCAGTPGLVRFSGKSWRGADVRVQVGAVAPIATCRRPRRAHRPGDRLAQGCAARRAPRRDPRRTREDAARHRRSRARRARHQLEAKQKTTTASRPASRNSRPSAPCLTAWNAVQSQLERICCAGGGKTRATTATTLTLRAFRAIGEHDAHLRWPSAMRRRPA